MRLLLLAFLLCAFAPMAQAQEDAQPQMPKEAIEEFAKKAHELMPEAMLPDGRKIGEERAKELQYPLVPYEIIELVVYRGHIAGFAAHCQLDWKEQFYLPLMTKLRKAHKEYSDEQFAYLGLLHGLSMGSAEKSQEGKECPETLKKKLSEVK